MTHGRDDQTLTAMIRLYCRARRHARPAPCPDCRALLEYAAGRLARCPLGENKPSCSKCHIHCYAPERRVQIREAMRTAGPRMLWHHPWLALAHWMRSRRRPPG